MLQLKHIAKSFAQQPGLLIDIVFQVRKAETLCLLGDSGSGKTTLLRVIAGLESPDKGKVYFEGRDITEVSVDKRNFGFMFQGFALFPHLNVERNIGFALEVRNYPKREIESRVRSLLKLMELEGLEARDVQQLSTGQKQRVALARCLAYEPKLLLLDEPMSSLDYKIKQKLLVKLKQIIKRLQLPVIYVTHDHIEAQAISDRILLLHKGRLVKT